MFILKITTSLNEEDTMHFSPAHLKSHNNTITESLSLHAQVPLPHQIHSSSSQNIRIYLSCKFSQITQMDITRALADINSSADHKTKTEKYKTLLGDLMKAKNVANLRAFIDHRIHFLFSLYLPLYNLSFYLTDDSG
jgi:hypothetical protein